MIAIPAFPLDTPARQWVDFCLSFRSVPGFIQVFEEKWLELGGIPETMGAAYESTEVFYNQLFGQRRYRDREVFYSARSRHYSQEK